MKAYALGVLTPLAVFLAWLTLDEWLTRRANERVMRAVVEARDSAC